MTDWYILKREQSLDFTKYFKNDCHWLWLFLSYHNNSESSVSINFSSGCHNTYISTMGNWSQFLANWIKFLGFCVEKKNQLDVTECFNCTYDTLNMFRGLLCPSSGARDYMCVITAYGVQCFFAGCRGQEEGFCSIPLPERTPCCPAHDPNSQSLHTIGGNRKHIV